MHSTKSNILAALSAGFTALLLASCASVEQGPNTSEPEASISQSAGASESGSESTGNYISYQSFQASEEQYAGSKVVLFFNAVWCSTCKEARDNFEASLSEIPDDLTIVVVDFDNSIGLRKKYSVTVQHTFVEINSAGEELGKWSGSVSVAEVVGQLS